MSHLEKLYVEKDLVENICKNLVEKNSNSPTTGRDLWLLHQYTDYLSGLNMDMDQELYKKTYTDALDSRARQIQTRLEFMKKVKENAQIIKHAQKKYNKREKGLWKDVDTILDSTMIVDGCDSSLDEIFNDSKNIDNENKIDGISSSLLPKHVGVWDKTKESYKKSIQFVPSAEDPQYSVLSHMIESGLITLPTPPENSL